MALGDRFSHERWRRTARVSRVLAHRRRRTDDSSSRTTRSRAGIECRSARSSAMRRSASSTCAAQPLGSVEESFIARLKPGDRFVFAGTPLEFVRVRDMKAWVKRAPNAKGAIPRWAGSRMPLSGRARGNAPRATGRGRHRRLPWPGGGGGSPAARGAAKVVAHSGGERAVDRAVKTREGWHLFVYPFEGRLVHEGMAALVRLSVVANRADHVFDGVERLWVRASVDRRARHCSKALDNGLLLAARPARRHHGCAQRGRDGEAPVSRAGAHRRPGVSRTSAFGKDCATAPGVERVVL